MAKLQNQGQTSCPDCHGTCHQEHTTREKKTDTLRSTDHLNIYTAAVQKVLNHNFNIAKQVDPHKATSIHDYSNCVLTKLQRPVSFNIEWESRVPSTSNAFTICPTSMLPLPELTVGAPKLSHWRFTYNVNGEAVLTRFGWLTSAEPLKKALGLRDMATFTYADLNSTNSLPTIKFEPHEDEITRQGVDNVQTTTSDMVLSKDMFDSNKYSVNLPDNLGGVGVMWVLSHVEGYADGRLCSVERKEGEMAMAESVKKAKVEAARKQEAWMAKVSPKEGTSTIYPWVDSKTGHLYANVGEKVESKHPRQHEATKKTAEKSSWKIYPTQQLIDSYTGSILATYNRNIPGSKMAGTLTIYPKILTTHPERYEHLSSELIEGIAIVTAALVDVQRRGGLLSGLWEAGKESLRWLEEAPHPLHSDP